MTKPPTTSTSPLRVAAYCRIDATGEEQIQRLENQRTFYAELINASLDWRMAGIFADNGSSNSPRPEFQEMLRKCRQQEIDLILVHSLSRFSRDPAELFITVTELRELGIAVIFEKENINTMDLNCYQFMPLMFEITKMENDHFSQDAPYWYNFCMWVAGRPARGPRRIASKIPGHPSCRWE